MDSKEPGMYEFTASLTFSVTALSARDAAEIAQSYVKDGVAEQIGNIVIILEGPTRYCASCGIAEHEHESTSGTEPHEFSPQTDGFFCTTSEAEDELDDDPVCAECGVYRSEHALCQEGPFHSFTTAKISKSDYIGSMRDEYGMTAQDRYDEEWGR